MHSNSGEFRWGVLRLHFRCAASIHFPPGRAANVLRGIFGWQMIEHAPEPVYRALFEPRSTQGPSGLADLPRPFVFRAAHLNGCTIRPNDEFHFDMNIFDREPGVTEWCAISFRKWAKTEFLHSEWREDAVFLAPPPGRPIHGLSIAFLTPTELKAGGGLAPTPEFGVLFPRVRDRVATLHSLYGGGPLETDYRSLGEQASQVRMTRCDIRHVDVQRTSSRTGQTHSLGGFIGGASYEGERLETFLPWLKAAEATGVGRQTTWGKGEIRVLL